MLTQHHFLRVQQLTCCHYFLSTNFPNFAYFDKIHIDHCLFTTKDPITLLSPYSYIQVRLHFAFCWQVGFLPRKTRFSLCSDRYIHCAQGTLILDISQRKSCFLQQKSYLSTKGKLQCNLHIAIPLVHVYVTCRIATIKPQRQLLNPWDSQTFHEQVLQAKACDSSSS